MVCQLLARSRRDAETQRRGDAEDGGHARFLLKRSFKAHAICNSRQPCFHEAVETEPAINRRRARRTPPKPSRFEWILKALRHPLTVLLMGTIITSLAIPWLNARSARARQIQEAQQAKAMEIIKSIGADNVRLNAVRSAFDVFEKEGGLTGGPALIEERRVELRKRVYDSYGDFEQTAWWWYGEIGREAELFGWLPKSDMSTFQTLATHYQENLLQSAAAIQKPWKRYLSQVNENTTDKKTPMMPAIESELGHKQAERDQLGAAMVRLFIK
jgi:hypothetical protein